MKRQWNMVPWVCLVLLLFSGCGGGGGSSSGTGSTAAPTKAIVKLRSQGTLPQGTQLSGIDITIKLPAGLTVKTDASGAVSSGVVTVSGVAAQGTSILLPPLYVTNTGSGNATLDVTLAGSNFGVGEFATVICDIAPGTAAPTSTDLVVANFSPADQMLRPVTALTPALTMQLE